MRTVRIRLGDWDTWQKAATDIRMKVFVREQGIPADIELDGRDEVCRHAIAVDMVGRFMGTGRLLPDGHIGRLAVLPKYRDRGVGTALMLGLMEVSFQRGDTENVIHAQVEAMPFYTRFGFNAEGREFDEGGIPHITMRRYHPA